MNEADRKIRELADWLKTSNEQPSNESWSELFRLAAGYRRAQAKKKRNAAYYRAVTKPKKQMVLKELNRGLKMAELAETDLNGVLKVWVKKDTEEWWRVAEYRRAHGLPSFPLDRDDGWYIEKAILEKAGVRIGN